MLPRQPRGLLATLLAKMRGHSVVVEEEDCGFVEFDAIASDRRPHSSDWFCNPREFFSWHPRPQFPLWIRSLMVFWFTLCFLFREMLNGVCICLIIPSEGLDIWRWLSLFCTYRGSTGAITSSQMPRIKIPSLRPWNSGFGSPTTWTPNQLIPRHVSAVSACGPAGCYTLPYASYYQQNGIRSLGQSRTQNSIWTSTFRKSIVTPRSGTSITFGIGAAVVIQSLTVIRLTLRSRLQERYLR